MTKKPNYENPAKDTRIATKEDIIACVLYGCLMLLVYMALVEYTRFGDRFSGILCVMGYLLILAIRVARRMHVNPVRLDNSMSALLISPLGRLVERMHSPALICDERGNLAWYNEMLAPWIAENGAKIGTSINSLLVLDPETHRVTVSGRIYAVDTVGTVCEGNRYIFFILSDCTDLVELEQRYYNERVAVAYISLDNIEEVMQYEHENFRDAVASVDEKLRHWVDSIGGIIKSYDNDKYIVFFDSSHIETFVSNRFEILDRIRSTHVGDGISVTISMGVSRIEGSLAARQDAAQAALDLALQRGGDQAVYKHEGGIEYYGGRTKTVYKRTNVKARHTSRQLYSLVARADNIIIMGHRFGDFDSIGSAIGIARICSARCDNIAIAVDVENRNIKYSLDRAQELEDYHGMFVGEREALELLRPDTLLIIVDVNNLAYVEYPSLVEAAQTIAVIDHHIQTTEFPTKVKLAYIEPSASSASELVAELIEYGLQLTGLRKEEAELLLAGILLDTNRFTRNTGTRTFAAARYLRGEGADPGETNDLFRVDAATFGKEARFMSDIQLYRGNIAITSVADNTDQSYRVIAAQAADKMLTINHVDASFALVKIGGVTYISARSHGTVNVQLILEKLKGGGHFDVAGAQVEGDSVQSVVSLLKEKIDEYLDRKA